MACYSVELKTRKYIKKYEFLLFQRSLYNK